MRWLMVVIALGWAQVAAAHFSDSTKPRTILVTSSGGSGLTVYIRAPAPLFYARDVVAAQDAQVPFEAEFLTVSRVGRAFAFGLSVDAINADPERFAERLRKAYAWRQDGVLLKAEVQGWALHEDRPTSPIATAEDALARLEAPPATGVLTFGTSYIDLALHLPDAARRTPLEVRSTHPFLPLPRDVTIDNHIRDLRGVWPVSVTAPGQLETPVLLHGSPIRAALEHVWQGVVHILIGADHVLLVVCIALGAGSARRLAYRVTAFTLGHAATLAAATLGFSPNAAWFIPGVETAIALTVLYAALAAWRRWPEGLAVLFAIGLLHGLGFAFVLDDLMGVDRAALAGVLAAFTLGLEIGQLAILALTIAVSFALARVSIRVETWARHGTLLTFAAIALFWSVTRGLSTVQSLG